VPDANAAMQNNTSIRVLKQQGESTCIVEKEQKHIPRALADTTMDNLPRYFGGP